jgi:Fe-S cluster assembly iron-binding protein IscA
VKIQVENLSRQGGNKNTMTATQKATEKLRDNLVQRCLDAGLGFRLIANGNSPVKGSLSIKVDHECPGDKVVQSRGIKIYLDPVSAIALEDYELDCLDEPNSGFCLKRREVGDAIPQVKKIDGYVTFDPLPVRPTSTSTLSTAHVEKEGRKMTTQITVRQTAARPVQPIHRRTLRALPLWLPQDAYKQLKRGYSDYLVCTTLRISQDVMEGVLMPALEEALWERGATSPWHYADGQRKSQFHRSLRQREENE